MRYIRRISTILLVVLFVMGCTIPAFAASGTCEIYYFTYPGSVGSGGSANIAASLSNMGYSAYRYADTHAYYVRRTMNNDKVFAIVSHGLPGRLICQNGETTVSASSVSSDDNNYSLAAAFSSGAFSNMLFAYYGACYTAQTDSTYGNLTTYTTNTLSAKCALGFTTYISNTCAPIYENVLFSYLEQGYSVSSANVYAKQAVINSIGAYGNIDQTIISGNPYTTIS